MLKCLKRLRSLIWHIFKYARNQLDGIVGNLLGATTFRVENLVPLARFDVWELEFGVVGVHRVDLVTTRRT